MKNDQIVRWAKASLTQQGYILQGPEEVIRAMPWSYVLRFSTSRGFVMTGLMRI